MNKRTFGTKEKEVGGQNAFRLPQNETTEEKGEVESVRYSLVGVGVKD